MTVAPELPAVARDPAAPEALFQADGGFDGNAYRKAVLVPMLAAGVVSIEDPFRVLGLDPSVDNTELIRSRLVDVVGFWQRERNSPRYKNLAAELVKRRSALEGMLLDPDKRALARLRVQGTRRAQDSARHARIDRLVKAVVNRHGGIPRSRLVLLETLALREGISDTVLAERTSSEKILEDGGGFEPLAEPLRRQIRGALDELALRGERSRSASLWAFLGLPATAAPEEVAERHVALVAENQAQAHDRSKTVVAELLANVKAVLLHPENRSAYLVVLLGELRERLTDRVLELAIVDGELWPADVETLVREAVALGTGISPDQARAAVRETATALGIAVTTGRGPDYVVCSSCGRTESPAVAGALPELPASFVAPPAAPGAQPPQVPPPAAEAPVQVPAPVAPPVAPPVSGPMPAGTHAEEWKALDREISQRRLVSALGRAQRLTRVSPDASGPGGTTIARRTAELSRQVSDARSSLADALALSDLSAQEQALYGVLERVPDLEEASTALANLPLAAPHQLTSTLEGTTMRLRWVAPPSARTMTYNVVRVTRDANGARVEHPLGVTTRCEAVDTDLPRAGLVWHEVTAQLGARRSAAVATEPQPVVPDVSSLRAALAPDGVSLTWTAQPGSDVVVERHRLDDPDAPLRRSRARGSRWRDTDVEAGAHYRYVVRVEAALGGVVARTPGCTVEIRIEGNERSPAMPTMRSVAPPPGRGLGLPTRPTVDPVVNNADDVVNLTITSVPPGIVVNWVAPPRAEVTVLLSLAPLGATGDVVSLDELSQRARIVGFAVGSGTAFDADPGAAAILTPVAVLGGSAILGTAVRHVAIGQVDGLRAEREGVRTMLRFSYPRGCGEAMVVWRRDRPPRDAADAEGGEIVTAESYTAHGGWAMPTDDAPAFFYILVLPVVHLGGEPVFGPGSPLRVG